MNMLAESLFRVPLFRNYGNALAEGKDLLTNSQIPTQDLGLFCRLAGEYSRASLIVDVYGMSQQAHESALELTTRGLQEGWLKTTIASRFSLEQIVEAHEATESGKILAKVVLLLS